MCRNSIIIFVIILSLLVIGQGNGEDREEKNLNGLLSDEVLVQLHPRLLAQRQGSGGISASSNASAERTAENKLGLGDCVLNPTFLAYRMVRSPQYELDFEWYGRQIILTSEVWQHIQEKHPKVEMWQIKETIEDGIFMKEGNETFIFYKQYGNLWLKVPVKMKIVGDYEVAGSGGYRTTEHIYQGIVKTAYFNSDNPLREINPEIHTILALVTIPFNGRVDNTEEAKDFTDMCLYILAEKFLDIQDDGETLPERLKNWLARDRSKATEIMLSYSVQNGMIDSHAIRQFLYDFYEYYDIPNIGQIPGVADMMLELMYEWVLDLEQLEFVFYTWELIRG